MDAPPIQYARTDDGVNIAYGQLSVVRWGAQWGCFHQFCREPRCRATRRFRISNGERPALGEG